MKKTLLITPPFLQPNCPYPATPYLKGYLIKKGLEVEQFDLSVELLNVVFSRHFLAEVFDRYDEEHNESSNIERIYHLRKRYLNTIECVMQFLRGADPTLANLITMPEYLPQASRLKQATDLEYYFGTLGVQDCAKYLATLYLQDLSDFIRATVSEHFEIVKYGESISMSVPEFSILEEHLNQPINLIEIQMFSLLKERIEQTKPSHVGLTIPFPGNLFSALRCAEYIKEHYPEIVTIAGGGYPTTELRSMSDKGVFRYFDYIVLDDGEQALENIIRDLSPENAYTSEGYVESSKVDNNTPRVTHLERGCPDFGGLPHEKYFSLFEVANPMHRLWGDGRWNKMTLAHGCYWGKCIFCDTSLDYISCYDAVDASTLVDWMEQIAEQTGSRGFHFTDEAAPPKILKDISLEIIRRGLSFTWWTNIRFETAFTGDLCHLMAAAGCIAVSGGLEVASDRLLELIEKGVTIETATIAMRNFYYNGIMVHAYLMYGLPRQTLQESIDALEVVRQMFRADLISSGFWHRYAMTIHSPSGQNPDIFGVKRKNTHPNSFANNEVYFVEDRGYNINLVGEALRESLSHYMVGSEINKDANRWFKGKAPQTTVENSLITDHLIKPDKARIFNENARLVWIGVNEPKLSDEGLLFNSQTSSSEVKLTNSDKEFISQIIRVSADLSSTITLCDAREIYKEFSEDTFLSLYHSKNWDKIRELGLLQI